MDEETATVVVNQMSIVHTWLAVKLSTWTGIGDLIVLGVLLSALLLEMVLAVRLMALLHDFSKHKNSS